MKKLYKKQPKHGPIGKPLKHRFVANTLKQRVIEGKTVEEIIPKTIREIVRRIKELSYSGTVLQKGIHTN